MQLHTEINDNILCLMAGDTYMSNISNYYFLSFSPRRIWFIQTVQKQNSGDNENSVIHLHFLLWSKKAKSVLFKCQHSYEYFLLFSSEDESE